MWPIKDPTQLPATMRLAHNYPYLNNECLNLWLDGLSVAHQLLERHNDKHGDEVYYQDNFGQDYIAALADPRIAAGVGIVYDEVADASLSHLHRNQQPAWQTFSEARERLKSAPRGAIALLNADDRWHIRIHAGAGYVSDCKTMRSDGPKPTSREIQVCLLSYEAYLARQQAEREQKLIRNFARLRELDLKSGMSLRDVELIHNYKRKKISFKIESISETGYLALVDGVLRGSRQRFTASVPACQIVAEQVQAPEKKKAVAPVDLETAALF